MMFAMSQNICVINLYFCRMIYGFLESNWRDILEKDDWEQHLPHRGEASDEEWTRALKGFKTHADRKSHTSEPTSEDKRVIANAYRQYEGSVKCQCSLFFSPCCGTFSHL